MAINKNLASAKYFYDNNDLEAAKKICETVLNNNKQNLEAINLITLINIKKENFQEALKYSNLASQLDDKNYENFFKNAMILQRLNKSDEALKNLELAINLNKKKAELYNLKAIIHENLGEDQKALENWGKAIKIKKDYAEVYFNIANYYNFNDNYEKSLDNYNKALQINNNYFLALVNRTDLYLKYQKYELALVDYEIITNQEPNMTRMHYNKAVVLNHLGQKKAAIASLNKAIELKAKFPKAYFLRGQIAWQFKLYKQALSDLEKAYSLKKNSDFLNSLIILKSVLCDWNNIENYQKELVNFTKTEQKTEFPIFIQHFEDSPELELKAAEAFNRHIKVFPRPALKNKKKKIRLGYYSADFRNHATAHLISRVFELHDKENFEIYAFSFCPLNEKDIWQKRINNSCDNFIDVYKKNDQEISKLSKELEIDIAIDLMGFVNNNRYKIFAKGCAPIQINYLGYPGTCGPNIMDYIIADNILINEKNKKFFSEKIISLPNCYQPNDDKKIISEKKITKKEYNLPENKFIFCNFNRSYKINFKMLNIWSDILKQKDNSIIWLFADNEITKKNLKNEFSKLGINSSRVVFADPTDHSNHLARHRLADLFLDTYPYTGHTTTSDALWTGLPVVTKIGNSFSSRVSSSILSAISLNELITNCDEEYKSLILNLSNDKNKLNKIKEKIIENIKTKPLFNSKLYTENLENAYYKVFKDKI
tara:strand:+ start:10812 stop:12947 length:2136 start_codon:yes stop_codon:yes gene_type:complete